MLTLGAFFPGPLQLKFAVLVFVSVQLEVGSMVTVTLELKVGALGTGYAVPKGKWRSCLRWP